MEYGVALKKVPSVKIMIFFVIFILINPSPHQIVHGEVFTSQSDLESLIYLRREVKSAIDQYILREERRLEYLKERLRSSRGLARKSLENPLDAGNPINAFLLVKGLSLDLAEIVTVAGDRNSFKDFTRVIEELNQETSFPDGEDINGAALGLIRLQDTYKLETTSLAKGAIGDSCCAPELSVDDCFELGRQSYNAKDYDYAIQWLTEALLRLPAGELGESNSRFGVGVLNENSSLLQDIRSDEDERYSRVSKSEILDYLNWAQDIKKTLEVGKDFLAQMTGIELDAFVEQVARAVGGNADDEFEQKTLAESYKSLCRGETRSNSSSKPELKCYYSTRGKDPFYIVGPVKEEVVNVDPPMWIFRDVIYDGEIEKIKVLAKPRFETAMVVNVLTGTNEKSQTRISKSAWLVDEDDPVVLKINKRIGYLTGLSMETAEFLQIANYGIGGMYLPHYDFAQSGQTANFVTSADGNRIATLLFYMSDVEKGGATVFPKLNLSIWPEKGSAAFWYNLKRDGEGDMRTQHAACPVLVGSKWVSNKWIHERGQEFRHRCGSHPKDNHM